MDLPNMKENVFITDTAKRVTVMPIYKTEP